MFPTVVVLLGILLAPGSQAQQVSPGMESYLMWVEKPSVALTNVSTLGLVAYQWDNVCVGHSNEGGSGWSDAASTLSPPLKQGELAMRGYDRPQCLRITAAIFADGTEIGDPAALSHIHDCRTAEAAEIHQTIAENRANIYSSEWDPEPSIARLKKRIAPYQITNYTDDPKETEMSTCHWVALSFLIHELQDYQSSLNEDPGKYGPRKIRLWRYLMSIETELGSTAYLPQYSYWK
jgi:hypothetical protein